MSTYLTRTLFFIIQDLKSLKEKFRAKIAASSDITIILDSLDQLSDHGAGLKDWIPKELPSDVTMVISAIPEEQFKVILISSCSDWAREERVNMNTSKEGSEKFIIAIFSHISTLKRG